MNKIDIKAVCRPWCPLVGREVRAMRVDLLRYPKYVRLSGDSEADPSTSERSG